MNKEPKKHMPQMARNGKNGTGDPKPRIICKKCKLLLPYSKFSCIDKKNPDIGKRDTCKTCNRKRADKERLKRANNWKHRPIVVMLKNSRQRAKRADIEHTLTSNDIIIPDICPVLGIKLEVGDRKNHSNAPSIDRIDNTKGYTKDNIVIVSCRANILKKDATIKELILLAEFYKQFEE